mmetsp:Transcript_70886/g.205486  ORF Transcript_70886/g.205486 Transcript_70886/m.205486 type:complete len:339 (+) Transcript_70886:214-1230(+)
MAEIRQLARRNSASLRMRLWLWYSFAAAWANSLCVIVPSLICCPTRLTNFSIVPSSRLKKAFKSDGWSTRVGSSRGARSWPTRTAHRFMCSVCTVVLCNLARAVSCSCTASFKACSPRSRSLKMLPSVSRVWSNEIPSVSRLKVSLSWRNVSSRTSASLTEPFSWSCSTSRLRNLWTMSITSVKPVTSRIFWKPSSVFCERSTCSKVIFCKELPHNFSMAYNFRKRPAEALKASFAASRATSWRQPSNLAFRLFASRRRSISPAITDLAAAQACRSASASWDNAWRARVVSTRSALALSLSAIRRWMSRFFLSRWSCMSSIFSFRIACSFCIRASICS